MAIFEGEAEVWRVAVENMLTATLARTFSNEQQLREFTNAASRISEDAGTSPGAELFTHHFDRLLSNVRLPSEAQQQWLRDHPDQRS